MSLPSTHEKIKSAYELLKGETISLETFSNIITLLKGIHPELDKKLAVSSELLSKLKKIQNVDIIELSATTLPEDSEEEKKRKKAVILFINSIKDLKSELKRVETELHKTAKPENKFARIISDTKGPLGIITIIALIIIGISMFTTSKNKTLSQQSIVAKPTLSVQPGSTKIKVIIFNGKKIPFTEFEIGHGPDCGGGGVPHYHAPNETTVRALDGTILQDPGSCGFGKVKDTNVIEVEISPTPSL